MTHYYIGLMSGTSMDGIDVALVEFSKDIKTLATLSYPLPENLKKALHSLTAPQENEIMLMGTADSQLGSVFAEAVNALLEKAKLSSKDIAAIGSHGQTIRHYPWEKHPFTLQIGDPNSIAAHTGITTIADFRRKDMAFGGHGAPLTPAFHQQFFRDGKKSRVIVNIGGISNITVLIPGQLTVGFDTGPGNTLLDAWCYENTGKSYDAHGQWAASGKCEDALLQALLKDPYFAKPAPKSTGREHFHLPWLKSHLEKLNNSFKPENIQATLVELTARSIIEAINNTAKNISEIILCGGGCHNDVLVENLNRLSPNTPIMTTESFGIHPDFVEAIAFAWFAKQTLEKKPSNLPAVTGAKKACVLGGIYLP